MKRMMSLFIVWIAAFILLPGAALAGETDYAAAAQALVQRLYDGEYEAVFDASTPEMQQALGSCDTYADTIGQVEYYYGAFEGMTGASAEEEGGYHSALITCSHAYGDITYSVVLDASGMLAGFTVAGVAAKASPGAADASTFVTEDILLRAGEKDETAGLLTLPVGEGPFPVVLMLHGGGPSDMNETAFGIVVFRDLAEGLAQAGVASIRYDKYTYAHADLLQANPDLTARLTINEEYIYDAHSALALLLEDERIGDIYLLGHSQGAMVAPRVMDALGAERFAGAVLLEGTPLHLWEADYYQSITTMELRDEENKAYARAQLNIEAAKKDKILAMSEEQLLQTTFFGLSAYYQADEMSVDAAETAKRLNKPLFIAQGGKDWQVAPANGIEAWQAALADSVPATYKLYPDMNHMLCDMEGEPTGTTDDYQAGSYVSQELIGDIAAWILGD